ncbi:STAS domain-containing protein [Rhizohabitans arisaemae]|uniref:STAS domain-containing protein n=1 Tax=Rhizohabitans arisaemae TaxID=2720610 RepID=UPI0024B07F93|nr:STAS domain-containing protein [Rhizohabitans arisaemae]
MVSLVLSTEVRNGQAVVTVAGELDTLTSTRLDRHLAEVLREHGTLIILEISGVTFMDSRALGVILHYWKQLAALDGRLALAGARYRSTKVLWVTGLIERLPVYDDVESALADP